MFRAWPFVAFKQNLAQVKLLWIAVIQANSRAGAMFRRSVWTPANFEVELPTPGNPWKGKKECNIKKRLRGKTLSQICSTRGRSSGEHWHGIVPSK